MATLLETDSVCFARDANGDLEFPLRLASGLEAVAIGVRTRLLLFAGEWFLDLDAGIKYLPTDDGVILESAAILGQPFDPVKTRSEFLREILSTPGVVDVPILRLGFDGSTRVLSITWVAQTRFGDTDQNILTVSL